MPWRCASVLRGARGGDGALRHPRTPRCVRGGSVFPADHSAAVAFRSAPIKVAGPSSKSIAFSFFSRFFFLRLAVSSRCSERAWLQWEEEVAEHMREREEAKKIKGAKSVDWDSGFSDG